MRGFTVKVYTPLIKTRAFGPSGSYESRTATSLCWQPFSRSIDWGSNHSKKCSRLSMIFFSKMFWIFHFPALCRFYMIFGSSSGFRISRFWDLSETWRFWIFDFNFPFTFKILLAFEIFIRFQKFTIFEIFPRLEDFEFLNFHSGPLLGFHSFDVFSAFWLF